LSEAHQKKTDPRRLRLLRVGREGCGERGHATDDEGTSVHYSIT
jgi:hypothetical protein